MNGSTPTRLYLRDPCIQQDQSADCRGNDAEIADELSVRWRGVTQVRVAEAVESCEVVGVRPRTTSKRRVDSTKKIRLVGLVTCPVYCRQLSH